MAESTMLDDVANFLGILTVFTRKKKPVVRRTRTVRQVLDKQGNIRTLISETSTVTYTVR